MGNVLKNRVNLWVCLLCSSDSHPISLFKAVIEISLVVPVAMRAASLDLFYLLLAHLSPGDKVSFCDHI